MRASAELPESVRAAVEIVVAFNVTAIADAVAVATADDRPAASVYGLAIMPDDAGELLVAQVVYLGLEPDRRQALEGLTEWDAFRAVWDPNEWWSGPLMVPAEPPAEVLSANDDVIAYAEREASVLGEPLVYDRVARRLTEAPPIAPTTADFVAFLFEEGFSEDLLASLRAGATPAAAAALKAQRLLPARSGNLEGAPRPFW